MMVRFQLTVVGAVRAGNPHNGPGGSARERWGEGCGLGHGGSVRGSCGYRVGTLEIRSGGAIGPVEAGILVLPVPAAVIAPGP